MHNKFKVGQLVNLKHDLGWQERLFVRTGQEDQYACLITSWWQTHRPFGLPPAYTYNLLLPNGNYYPATEDCIELVS